MSIRQKFAEMALDYLPDEGEITIRNPAVVPGAFMIALLGAIAGGIIGIVNIGESGNQYADKFADDYEVVLENLIEEKASYNSIYKGTHGTNDNTDKSYIMDLIDGTNNVSNEVSVDADTAASRLMHHYKLFADAVQKDPNIDEDDAGDLIEAFEENIIPLKDLGYATSPNSDFLRECQINNNTSFEINSCAKDLNSSNSRPNNEVELFMLYGAIAGVSLWPILPIMLDTGVSMNRNRLESWKKNKNHGRNPY